MSNRLPVSPSLSLSLCLSGLIPVLTALTCLHTLHTPCCMRNCWSRWRKRARLAWSERDKTDKSTLHPSQCNTGWTKMQKKLLFWAYVKEIPGLYSTKFLVIWIYVHHFYGTMSWSLSVGYAELWQHPALSRPQQDCSYFYIYD